MRSQIYAPVSNLSLLYQWLVARVLSVSQLTCKSGKVGEAIHPPTTRQQLQPPLSALAVVFSYSTLEQVDTDRACPTYVARIYIIILMSPRPRCTLTRPYFLYIVWQKCIMRGVVTSLMDCIMHFLCSYKPPTYMYYPMAYIMARLGANIN